ncbi:hypothetical protein [Asticcacaulis sp. MM231]|uniref:hypothetical protein n=1 Tax=Asticcacaulis sp. MM231 TaxID=3157666 RepID=UPI0032D58DB6
MFSKKRLSSLHLLSAVELALNIGWITVSSETEDWRLSQGMLRLLDAPASHPGSQALVLRSIHSEDRSRFKECLALMFRGIMPPAQTFRIARRIRGNGRALFHYQELTDSGGHPIYLLFARDVTAEHAVSQAFADAGRRLDVAMETLDVECLWRGDLKGATFDSVGRGRLNFAGAEQGLSWIDHVPADDRAGLHKSLDALIETNSRFSVRVNIICSDTVVRPYNLSAIPVKGASGKTVEWCGAMTKISKSERGHEGDTVAAILPNLTGAEVRAACGLLGWSHREAAHHSGLSKVTISRFASTVAPLSGIFKAKSVATFLLAIRDAGIVLTFSDAGGLCLSLDRRVKELC